MLNTRKLANSVKLFQQPAPAMPDHPPRVKLLLDLDETLFVVLDGANDKSKMSDSADECLDEYTLVDVAIMPLIEAVEALSDEDDVSEEELDESTATPRKCDNAEEDDAEEETIIVRAICRYRASPVTS